MSRFLLIVFMCVLMAPASWAQTAFQSQEEVARWMTFYYKKPEPDRLPEAMQYISRSFPDKKNMVAPMMGFLSGVFRANPEKVDAWSSALADLKETYLAAIVLGLWYSGLPDAKPKVMILLDRHPGLKQGFEPFRQGNPLTVEQIPLEQGPWVLDALWGKFMATGERAPVERIMTALPWIDIRGDTDRLGIGGAANWSLASNAVQHERVLAFCEQARKTQSPEVASKLDKVIAQAKQELQQQRVKPTATETPAP
ncbi:MAG: hypothetical protein LBP52_05585 [Burkholderiaceae bacterium]|nr:hypothetical protein [Burkholderiaceae bacterium]